MRLEQTATGVLVHGVGVVRVEVFDSLLEHLRLWSLLDGQQEEILVRVQRELVHRIDRGEVVQDEVQDRRAYRHGSVERGRLGDFFAGCLCDFERLGHLVGRDLGVVQGVDELDVVEERAVRVGQQVEEGILELQDGPLALGNLAHERDALLVQVEPLLLDDDVEELILQPLLLDDKVDDCHLRGHLRSVVRVGQLRSEVQPEVRRVVHLLVPEFDAQRVALLDEALAQDGFQNRVNFFADVLDEDGIAKLDGVLHLANHVRHVQSHGDQTVGLLGVLDPLVPLALGVDQQRPASAAGHHHSVLRAKRIRRQLVDVPVADVGGVREEEREIELVRRGNLELFHLGKPRVLDQGLAVVRGERTRVGHERRRDDDVAGKTRDFSLVLDDGFLPSDLLAREAAHEGLGAGEFLRQVLELVLQSLLVARRFLVLVLQSLDLVEDGLELFLGGGESLLFLLESLLGVLELLLLGRHLLIDPAVHVHGVHPLA